MHRWPQLYQLCIQITYSALTTKLIFLLFLCSVNKANIEEMKRRWVDAGRPQFPEWRQLMEGLVAPEHLTKVQRRQ
jgi:hypothetical protein